MSLRPAFHRLMIGLATFVICIAILIPFADAASQKEAVTVRYWYEQNFPTRIPADNTLTCAPGFTLDRSDGKWICSQKYTYPSPFAHQIALNPVGANCPSSFELRYSSENKYFCARQPELSYGSLGHTYSDLYRVYPYTYNYGDYNNPYYASQSRAGSCSVQHSAGNLRGYQNVRDYLSNPQEYIPSNPYSPFYNGSNCACSGGYSPVCGIDRQTYTSTCAASCRGMPVLHLGPCDATDAINVASQCNCPSEYRPVCGTDGRTYNNACYAACSGMGVIMYARCQ